MPVPYYDPETIRKAAFKFLTRIENGASFPLLATGTLVLGPEFCYKTWDEWLEGMAQKAAIEIRGSNKWDRNTFLFMELMRTLTADPLLWRHAGGAQTSARVLDTRHVQSSSAALLGGRAERARKATLEEIRRVVEDLPTICLADLKGWSLSDDYVDNPIFPWACMRAMRFYDIEQAAQFDEVLSGGKGERQGRAALSNSFSQMFSSY